MSKKRIVGVAIAIASLTSLESTKVFGQAPTETTESTQSDLLELSLEELLNMKVTSGSFLDLDLKNSALSLTVINQEQIHLSGARHLSELLEIYVPGFQYMYNKWNGVIWGMRGVAADRNTKFIFLVNGHKMNTEARDGANMELDLGMLGDIERVEIIRGPAGLIYGSGAIGGVVNVVTEKYKKDEAKISTTQGTWNGENFSQQYEGSVAQKINEHSNIVVTGGFRKSDGIGTERGRLLGRPSWPYPQWMENPPADGVPTSGSAWSTPGNYRFGVDFNYKNFRYYSRYTHQVTNASGLFPIDGWPDYVNTDSLAPDRMIDGKLQSVKGFYGQIEPGNTNRRQYVVNNFTNQFSYELPVKDNSILLNAGFDMNTNRIQLEDMKSAVVANANSYSADRHTMRIETFGERRYNASAMYVLKTVPKLQLALGYQFRLFDIGKDMAGYNSQEEKANHPIVSNILYTNHAIFAEGMYKLTEKLNAQFGLRYDRHTRTAELGGVITPKIALVAKANENNIIKLIYQTSANNGSADNYEFNRNTIGDNGQPFAGNDYHYENPTQRPGSGSNIIPPVSNEILHKLKPERSNSIELTSVHSMLDNRLSVLPSLSYTSIKDLFAWNQKLFRVINSGSYNFANAELDVRYNTSKVSFGVNHVLSKLVNTKVSDYYENYQLTAFSGYDSVSVGNGVYKYTPKPLKSQVDPTKDSVTTISVNSVRDQVTVDSKNFLSLASNVTKIYLDYKVTNWLTVHTDARLFWGLTGRRDIYNYSAANPTNPILQADYGSSYAWNNQYPTYGVQSHLIMKWNMSVNIQANEKLSFSVYAYDLLAGAKSIHSLRWGQMYNAQEATDLYGIDRTSFAVKLNYKFGL
ncbi:MAG: TonB-dependent receptor [Sporocytophaga sp.]|uniref:TonB-dependent receptor plug domain-containing protein n=1 Tax=Sporocytophaga sp. TaxID=2231183 RepID=UPI001B03C8EB|nr:TonB-dependent receptor [Sporocytophaga sp.]MBO9699494.1 TonB-dependent receptor [Sporocytophaga sp.]